MRGMCTIRGVQAHLYKKFGKMFKYYNLWYAMSARLGLRYRTVVNKRIVFSQARIKVADCFCRDLAEAMREESAGRCVIVYMDESYCHQNHMPSKAWQEDDDAEGNVRGERTRSK